MPKFLEDKRIIAAFCFAGFVATVSITPLIYLVQSGRLDLSSKNVAEAKAPGSENVYEGIAIRAKTAAVYDVTANKFLYSKSGNFQLPLASITKVMSGITTLEIAEKLNIIKPVKFSGKWWNLYDLLKFSLVSSSNSGVADIAESISQIENIKNRSVTNINFVAEMNALAKKIGLRTMYFINETGLDANESIAGAYGSAEDVSRMFAYAVGKYPNIFGATKYSEWKMTSEDGSEKVSKNTNMEVGKMTTLIASKTGTTDLAGGNLVVAFDAGISHPVVVTVLGSTPEDRAGDVEKLMKATIEHLSL